MVKLTTRFSSMPR